MDSQRFDALSRSLARGFSRRSVVGAIAVGGLGFLLRARGTDAYPDEDTCQTVPGGHCTQHLPCCSGICNDGGQCGCAAPEVECNGFCTNPKSLANDPFNCGACGKVCEGRCANGSCEQVPPPEETGPRCNAPHKPCGDRCCPSWTSCVEGECQVCPPETDCLLTGFARCGQYSTDGLCCPAPAVAACCCDSSPGAGDGWAGCCIDEGPDATCPPCVYRESYAGDLVSCRGGAGDCCGPADSFPACCSRRGCPGGECITACAT